MAEPNLVPMEGEVSEQRGLQPARHHSYLPPIRNIMEDDQTKLNWDALVTLELHDVILFPGCSLPIRIEDTQLQRSIVKQEIRYLGVLCTDWSTRARALSIESPEERRVRDILLRRGMGPVRLRRFSQQLIDEVGNDFDLDDTTSSGSDMDQVDHANDTDARGSTNTHPRPPSSNYYPSDPNNPYVGRIGTLVKILYTHQPEANSQQPHGPLAPMYITAEGISRFCIIGYGSSPHLGDSIASSFSRKCFRVQEIRERPMPKLPSIQSLPKVRAAQDGLDSDLHRLALVSPMPLFVLKKTWVWKLVAEIRNHIGSSPGLHALDVPAGSSDTNGRASNTVDTPGGKQHTFMEPVAFSYWLSANLPLKLDEKAKLLAMTSALERLRYILEKVKAATPPILCQYCFAIVADSSEMFTVSGAEGTTGNYVNPHGAVHQTITVRRVSRMSVRYQGGPETQHSWFPQYSWKIMNCRLCSNHLGWKFDLVQGEPSRDRPTSFFGLAAGTVTIGIARRLDDS